MQTVIVMRDARLAGDAYSRMVCSLELSPVCDWLTENMQGTYHVREMYDMVVVECDNDHDALILGMHHGID